MKSPMLLSWWRNRERVYSRQDCLRSPVISAEMTPDRVVSLSKRKCSRSCLSLSAPPKPKRKGLAHSPLLTSSWLPRATSKSPFSLWEKAKVSQCQREKKSSIFNFARDRVPRSMRSTYTACLRPKPFRRNPQRYRSLCP